ncbi:uncharacterized protein MELLADRAFT_88800 [Melampsora larici-populina 98AG31]|uniref:Glucose-methanol-choline oxidoreductase N-terminal domain-containing protein n=1 Tax=Melampsora larici-populina (strain 98AG31 / pathotype 3-4-7) TaxID=747676 RepID=F4RT12_MELLP|nr:uncharacterized protein MELLADRAFT_88800 [Melampsora larici-populina 98AG31]EGG04510.1 hypothetical protein MELLADRAFT_88800 [Melampsora larici-populina 98AG31]
MNLRNSIWISSCYFYSLWTFSNQAVFCQKSYQTSKDVFDYIVVGGGPGGLAVASRLSQHPNIKVLVLEAGGDGLNNTAISVPGLFINAVLSPVDWNYTTIPLEKAGNQSLIYPLGKVLGGTSALNHLVSSKASRADYDAIEQLGNPGWGWTEFDKASKESEKLLFPNEPNNFSFIAEQHGLHGPVKNSFPKYFPPTFPNYFPAVKELHHQPALVDGFGGYVEGPYVYPSTIDENAERVTSATAYYFPFKSRPNLVVRLNCEVDRLLTSKSSNGDVIIKGVRYDSLGSTYHVEARKEVILSAGPIGSPAILERSGVGEPATLEKLGIPILIDLPGVGSNLMDHPLAWTVFQLSPGQISADDFSRNSTFAREAWNLYRDHREGILTHEEIAEGLEYLRTNTSSLPESILETVKERILNGTPIEFVLINQRSLNMQPSANASYISNLIALQYPLSRGTSHISSRDPRKPPLIDTGFFRHPFDLWLLSKASKHARAIMKSPSWSSIISNEHLPGPQVNTDQEWRQYVTNSAGTVFHPVGTAAMLPRELGGVVNPDLQVYGTQRLRVIDASIIPMHLAMHPHMTVYAIGEIGAKKILKSGGYKA